MVPAPGSPFARKAGWRLGLPYLLSLSGLLCLLLFTFVLILALCSVEHAFQFCFVASSLASFCFCIKLCLFAYFSLNYCVGLFMLTYFHTLAFGWPLFCFTKFLWMYDILFRNCLDLFGFLCSFANVWHISCVLSDFFIYFYLFIFNLFHVDNKIEYIY